MGARVGPSAELRQREVPELSPKRPGLPCPGLWEPPDFWASVSPHIIITELSCAKFVSAPHCTASGEMSKLQTFYIPAHILVALREERDTGSLLFYFLSAQQPCPSPAPTGSPSPLQAPAPLNSPRPNTPVQMLTCDP